MIYYVYQIKINNITRYIGMTNNLIKRQKEHNYWLKKQKTKILYININKISSNIEIKLEKIKSFNSKVEARRFECYLILDDYFKNKILWQRIPRISDV